MRIGGLEKLSLVDYPSKLSAVVFTLGCNLRCPFCHNPDLVLQTAKEIPEDEVLTYLASRQDKLDAVVITGGEPTLHSDLDEFITKVKDLGYHVKLDSNGTNPKVLRDLLNRDLLDYVAIDLKAPLAIDRYSFFAGVSDADLTDRISETINTLLDSTIEYELRTTAIKGAHTEDDLREIIKIAKHAKKHTINEFRSERTLDPKWAMYCPYTSKELDVLMDNI